MNLAPCLKQRYFDEDGNPLAGGKLYTYEAGTTTPQATYTDQTGATPNANPVVLDANGEADVWIDLGLSYKFVLKDSADVTQWTVDSVGGLEEDGPENLSVLGTVAANAMTYALKQADGSSDPSTSNPCSIRMRSPTLANAVPEIVSFQEALSLTIPSTATMGAVNSVEATHYIYAIYDGTNKELAVIGTKLDENVLHNTTHI